MEYNKGNLDKTTNFVGNFVFIQGKPGWINYDEGHVIYKSSGNYIAESYLKDHLGNIRVAFGYENGVYSVRQVNSYYPFGMNIKELTSNSNSYAYHNEYKFNGKMMQDEMGLGWLDYGARFYDPVLGRWHSVDPMAEKYRRWSPYNYCVDNPMKFVDPDGMAVHDPPIPGMNSMFGAKEIVPTVKSIAADLTKGPLLYFSIPIAAVVGQIADASNGGEGRPSWAYPVQLNDDLSVNFRTDLMQGEVPFDKGMEILGAVTGQCTGNIVEGPGSTVINYAISELCSKTVENIPKIVNEKVLETATPQKNENMSKKQVNFFVPFLYKSGTNNKTSSEGALY